jgi:hypothetical protein
LTFGWQSTVPAFTGGSFPAPRTPTCDTLAAALGTPLPDELLTLLKWHNGQSADAVGAFERDFFLPNTAQIAQAINDLRSEPGNGWKPGLIPFLADDQDDFLCLDTTRPGTPVAECWRGKTIPRLTAPSVTSWLEEFAAALERSEYVEDPERGSFRRKTS